MGLDPIVLVTRTAAVVLNPFLRHFADLRAQPIAGEIGTHGYLVDVATLILFMTIMAGTTKVSRIWCRTACPLGAYLAIASRNAILRRDTEGCVQCGICAHHCPTGAISFTNAEFYNEAECIKCFACSSECPVDANYFGLKAPFPTVRPSQAPAQLDRRAVLATGALAVVSTPGLYLSAGDPKSTKKLIRPPMSREEHDFLSSCIRCAECMKACPTGILKPAGLEHGLRALWSPVMVATEGYCQEGCNSCSQACPTDAIMKYPIEKKYSFKAGTAVFDSSRCISYAEGKFCSECVRVCPTNAIEFRKGWEPEGTQPGRWGVGDRGSEKVAPEGQTPTRPFHVNYDRCVGCGACEFSCNQIVMGEPAMTLTSSGRATRTSLEASSPSAFLKSLQEERTV
jgi:ferredoxin